MHAANSGCVKTRPNLTAEAIAESNAHLLNARLPGDLNAQFRAHMQVDDSVEVGIMLNTLDDWDTVHRYALTNRANLEPIVPAISPLTAGPTRSSPGSAPSG